MKTKQARKLKHLVFIEQKQHVKDEIGGESDDEWIEFVKIYAEIKPIRGAEFIAGQAHQNSVTHRVIVRFTEDLKPNMRVNHKGRFFNIEAVRDFSERNVWLELMCKEML